MRSLRQWSYSGNGLCRDTVIIYIEDKAVLRETVDQFAKEDEAKKRKSSEIAIRSPSELINSVIKRRINSA